MPAGDDHPAGSLPVGMRRSRRQRQVYWLNFKSEMDGTLQRLAARYTEETGVDVKVITAASGTYVQTLIAEMDKSAPPTMYVICNAPDVEIWQK